MKLKKIIPAFLLLSTVAVGLWLTPTQASADAADTMVDISGKKVLVGYWHNWASKGRDGYKQGTSASLNLSEVNQAYNVVPVSFIKAMARHGFLRSSLITKQTLPSDKKSHN